MPFMSREMLMGTEDGEVKADSKVDIWRSGILLHQLIAHEFPIKSFSTQAKTITMPLMSREMLMGTEDGEVKADSKGFYFIS
ncbi:MAG: hypothetical protein EZS28_035051 [Streblomastix strix]|uniref:Protein kinase domain-containing protein n=1 Tax=Streblomastix strix TaxID=222440 RepID=A0A5J4UH58_9EUKA|nr:MAG: hypothetical protein EZS28_035051 [Streblomastix strix]